MTIDNLMAPVLVHGRIMFGDQAIVFWHYTIPEGGELLQVFSSFSACFCFMSWRTGLSIGQGHELDGARNETYENLLFYHDICWFYAHPYIPKCPAGSDSRFVVGTGYGRT